MTPMIMSTLKSVALGASLALGLLLAATPARAASITYEVHVDTTSLSGTLGYLDFQFNPGGLDALAATAAITGFNPYDATLIPSAILTGDASGELPADVTLGNSGGFNDYFHGLTFGNQFSFFLTLTGDALSPASTPLSGTAFSLLLFDADGFTPLLTVDPDGRLASLQIGPTGAVSVETFARAQGGDPAATVAEVTAPVPVPEPTTLLLVATGAGAIALRRRQSKA
jgi:hypothetical protein